jgi:hypothetical protein
LKVADFGLLLHILIFSTENLGVVYENVLGEILRQDIAGHCRTTCPDTMDEILFLEFMQELLTDFNMSCTSADTPIIRQIFCALIINMHTGSLVSSL